MSSMFPFVVRMTDMFNTNDVFDDKKYHREDKESFIFFLKRHKLLVELTALHSKARASLSQKLMKAAFKNYLMPTDLIREYYGDQVTIYFEWMNHFISIKSHFLLQLYRVVDMAWYN
jgi:hypothetical protein